MSDVNTWNVAAASNNAAAPNGFPEGMPPSGVNDAAREVMAAVARYRSDTDGVNTSSGTNTITLAASRTMTAYAQGDLYTFKAGGTNTGAATLNVDGLGAKDIQLNGAALTGDEITSGLIYTVVYDGTQFQLLNTSRLPIGSVSGIAANVATFLATPSSANLAAAVTDETGSGALVFATSPTLVTPALGAATATSLNVSGEGIFGSTLFAANGVSTGGAAIEIGFGRTGDGASFVDFHSTAGTDFEARIIRDTGANGNFEIANTGTGYININSAGVAPLLLSTSSTERMRITSAGNVLIGSDSPITSSAGESAQRLQIIGETTNLGGHVLIGAYNSSGGGPTTTFAKARGSKSSATIVNNGDNIAVHSYEGYDGSAFKRAAAIAVEVDGTPAANDMPGRIVFQTTLSGTSTALERMRITNAGNVGIGTNAPATRFHVDGTIRYTNRPAAGTITAIGFDTNGDLKASSSSQRYKYDIEDYGKGLDEVMQLRPVSFKYNGETRENIGFIAEEIDAAGLSEVMLYNDQSQPEGVLYANMIALLTKAIQEQQATIAALEARLAAVEAR